MNSEARNEFDAKYEERVRKIREAASAAIKELDQLPSVGSRNGKLQISEYRGQVSDGATGLHRVRAFVQKG